MAIDRSQQNWPEDEVVELKEQESDDIEQTCS